MTQMQSDERKGDDANVRFAHTHTHTHYSLRSISEHRCEGDAPSRKLKTAPCSPSSCYGYSALFFELLFLVITSI